MSDLIDRQVAIDAAKDWYDGLICGSFKGLEKRLQSLPSAQHEIIRCKDCKLFGDPNCLMFFDGYDWAEPDGYCHAAERREE